MHWSIGEGEETAFYNLDNMLWIRMTLSRTLVGTEGKKKHEQEKRKGKYFGMHSRLCILLVLFLRQVVAVLSVQTKK